MFLSDVLDESFSFIVDDIWDSRVLAFDAIEEHVAIVVPFNQTFLVL